MNCAQVASATHDRQHADKVLNEYVTTTITTVMSAFFGSQFSEQSTAVKVTSDAVTRFVQILEKYGKFWNLM